MLLQYSEGTIIALPDQEYDRRVSEQVWIEHKRLSLRSHQLLMSITRSHARTLVTRDDLLTFGFLIVEPSIDIACFCYYGCYGTLSVLANCCRPSQSPTIHSSSLFSSSTLQTLIIINRLPLLQPWSHSSTSCSVAQPFSNDQRSCRCQGYYTIQCS